MNNRSKYLKFWKIQHKEEVTYTKHKHHDLDAQERKSLNKDST
jgi:hypothetical protein